MADYPGALHAFIDPAAKAGAPLASEHVAAHVELADELAAVQAELGTAPSGPFATVKARLAALPIPGAYGLLKPAGAVRAYAASRVDANAYGTTDRLTCVPAYIAVAGNSLRYMFVDVGTGAVGAVVRAGIYAADPATLWPSTLLREWGTVDASTAGEKALDLGSGSEHDPGVGLIWLAAVIQGGSAVTSRYVASTTYGQSIVGESTTGGSSVAYHYPYWDGVSGALPGTLGTPSGWDLTAIYQAARVQ